MLMFTKCCLWRLRYNYAKNVKIEDGLGYCLENMDIEELIIFIYCILVNIVFLYYSNLDIGSWFIVIRIHYVRFFYYRNKTTCLGIMIMDWNIIQIMFRKWRECWQSKQLSCNYKQYNHSLYEYQGNKTWLKYWQSKQFSFIFLIFLNINLFKFRY